uniref:Uncharacterized protein n=1 Tax=viral metagenome TaxID=1070528 RepID=A0A6C0CLY9_9ZZZZ
MDQTQNQNFIYLPCRDILYNKNQIRNIRCDSEAKICVLHTNTYETFPNYGCSYNDILDFRKELLKYDKMYYDPYRPI